RAPRLARDERRPGLGPVSGSTFPGASLGAAKPRPTSSRSDKKPLVGNEGGIAGRRRGGGPPPRGVTRSGTERAPRPRVGGGRASAPLRTAPRRANERRFARRGAMWARVRLTPLWASPHPALP